MLRIICVIASLFTSVACEWFSVRYRAGVVENIEPYGWRLLEQYRNRLLECANMCRRDVQCSFLVTTAAEAEGGMCAFYNLPIASVTFEQRAGMNVTVVVKLPEEHLGDSSGSSGDQSGEGGDGSGSSGDQSGVGGDGSGSSGDQSGAGGDQSGSSGSGDVTVSVDVTIKPTFEITIKPEFEITILPPEAGIELVFQDVRSDTLADCKDAVVVQLPEHPPCSPGQGVPQAALKFGDGRFLIFTASDIFVHNYNMLKGEDLAVVKQLSLDSLDPEEDYRLYGPVAAFSIKQRGSMEHHVILENGNVNVYRERGNLMEFKSNHLSAVDKVDAAFSLHPNGKTQHYMTLGRMFIIKGKGKKDKIDCPVKLLRNGKLVPFKVDAAFSTDKRSVVFFINGVVYLVPTTSQPNGRVLTKLCY